VANRKKELTLDSAMILDALIALLSRWLHVMAAVAAVGGTLFVVVALLPAAHEHSAPELLGAVQRRFKRLVHVAIGLLLLTGLYNYLVVSLPRVREWESESARGLYHGLMGVKIVLAVVLFAVALLLLKPVPAMQAKRQRWLLLNFVLGSLIVLIGSVLRRMW